MDVSDDSNVTCVSILKFCYNWRKSKSLSSNKISTKSKKKKKNMNYRLLVSFVLLRKMGFYGYIVL